MLFYKTKPQPSWGQLAQFFWPTWNFSTLARKKQNKRSGRRLFSYPSKSFKTSKNFKFLIHKFHLELSASFVPNYQTEQLFGPIHRAFWGDPPDNKIQKDVVINLLSDFDIKKFWLTYNEKICVPQANVQKLFELANNNRLANHFSASKKLSHLKEFHWKNKWKAVENHGAGCRTCQISKDWHSILLRRL